VKVADDYSDLFAGHTTWESYVYMLRIYKQYNFTLTAAQTSSPLVAFSGYPGCIASIDDFYITSASLQVTETTNGNYNLSLYKRITPKSIFSWIRSVVTNRMALDGKSWANIFCEYNSGTYNNQWFVVDYKLFEPFTPLKENTLWVLEQIPGYCHSADKTDALEFGYWPSYNTPYFHNIFDQSGFGKMVEKHGNDWSYDLAPRAKIFRRDHHTVQNISSMQYIMQYNNYLSDPFSEGDPTNQISARADLYADTKQRDTFGGVDSKITSASMVKSLAAYVISGPSHESLPPFSWAAFESTPHIGQPEVFDFDWMYMQFSS